jgi:hypothetical protein
MPKNSHKQPGGENKVVGEGTSQFIFGPDGKFKGLLLDRRYAQKRVWAKVTRVKANEDRFEHEFLVEQLVILGKPGKELEHWRLLLRSVTKILGQERSDPETLLERYCLFTPILAAIREILTADSESKAKNLSKRFETRMVAARKMLSLREAEANQRQPEDGPQRGFIAVVRTLAKRYDRQPTMAEVGKELFPDKLDHERRIRVAQLADETGFKLPHEKPGRKTVRSK